MHRVVILAPQLAWAREIERAYKEKTQIPVYELLFYPISRVEQMLGLSDCEVIIHYQWAMTRTLDEFLAIQHRLHVMQMDRKTTFQYVDEGYYR